MSIKLRLGTLISMYQKKLIANLCFPQVPKEVCMQVPRQVLVKVPRQVCQKVPKQECY